MSISAILWDYDGTIVNSVRKNMAVTVEVLKFFDPQIEQHLPKELTSYEAYSLANHTYKNWRELYRNCFGIAEERLDEAGRLWTPEQLKNTMKPDLFTGMDELFMSLKPIKMGICSQNSSRNIRETLQYYGVSDCFETLIGVDEVAGTEQKPHPAGFIKCLNELAVQIEGSTIFYIGDHSEDVTFGKNAERLLSDKGCRVVCIAVDFLGQDHLGDWTTLPDYKVKSTMELREILFSKI